jgi:hypothetical protein
MPKLSIAPGSTSQTVNVFIQDSSVTTNVAGRTGLVFNTASLTCYYARTRGASTAVTLATLASATAAWATGGFIEIDATNQPGLYRLDLPDAVLASGVRSAVVYLRGASNMVPCILEIDLDAEVDIRLVAGQTASAAGTVTFPGTIASTTNITAATGITVATNSDKTGYSLTATTGLGNQTANITGNLSGSVGSVTGAVGSVTGAVGSVTAGVTLANGAHGGAAATLTLLSAAITNTAGSALTLTSSGSNGHGLSMQGHGTGSGMQAVGGATGVGMRAVGGATSGVGFIIQAQAGNTDGFQSFGSGTGDGAYFSGGASGDGLHVTGGGTTGVGLRAVAVAGNNAGVEATGFGSGAGMLATGGISGSITGNLSGSVGSVGAGGITASSIATDAIGSDELATTAVTEIVNGILDAYGTRGSVTGTPSASTFNGDGALSSVDAFHAGSVLKFTSGTLNGQSRRIATYTGSTKAMTFDANWTASPSAADTFVILGRII